MNIVVIGAQWGDEGKGKIVDFLAVDSELVVRFSGGANAGHTVVTGGTTYKLHLIPSGIIYPDQQVVLGTGMVIDPEAMFKELAILEEQGIDWKGRILVSDRAHIVLPSYKERDKQMDKERKRPIGTTGRGIGITYALKAHRDGVRLADLFDDEFFNDLPDGDREFLKPYREKLQPMVADISSFLHEKMGKRILFEGAQGTLLDVDHGTYPYCSSGCSVAAGAAIGSGIGPRKIDRILGVFKAYSTRVGNGPFPSEFRDDRDGNLCEIVRETGREYGVTTGRPRRCGYLDLVALRYACMVNSIDSLVQTHIDVYDEFDEIKACVGYELDGKTIHHFPASIAELNRVEPVLKSFKGWKQSLKDCRSYDDLPKEARVYLSFIQEYTETPVDIVSVGYEREQTILRTGLWTQS